MGDSLLLTYADIAVDGMLPGSDSATLTYQVGPEWIAAANRGAIVWVPLRKQAVLGVVVNVHQIAPDFEVRPIFEVVPDQFALTDQQVDLSIWLQRASASSLFGCLSLWMPPGVVHTLTPWFDLKHRAAESRTRVQDKVLDILGVNGSMSLDQLQGEIGSSLASVIPDLERADLIQRSYHSDIKTRRQRSERWWIAANNEPNGKLTDRQQELLNVVAKAGINGIRSAEAIDRTGISSAVSEKLISQNLILVEERPVVVALDVDPVGTLPTLTDEQAIAWADLEREALRPTGKPQVLFGITGSGKTELYLRAVASTIRMGKQAIILVPEIALTTQIAQRVKDRFPGQVAVMHSGISMGPRQEAWAQVDSGLKSIVVGARSALFAPVHDLGLIVIDEEHDSSYKQDAEPRYNARSFAEMIARERGAALIVGSATPRTETLWQAERGDYALHRLSRRAVASAPDLPPIRIVDIREELHAGHTALLSRPLIAATNQALARNEQVMLLLNRRGMSTVVICRNCGLAVTCPNCSIPLVYHEDRAAMICHRCDHRELPRRDCPSCSGPLDYFGAGTQRVESEVRRTFPNARVVRWDQDVARRRGSNATILQSIEKRDVDIVIGTQLIAKGLDLAYVTTVGIVNADVGLHFPDYRSGERTFQLITQMAGRAGRRTPNSSVIVQSYSPDHYVLRAASTHDVKTFYAQEIKFREEFRYPPFVRMIRFLIRRPTDDDCAFEADTLVRALGRHARALGVEIEIVGPAPAFIARVRGEQQWHLILKANPDGIERMLDGLPRPHGWTVDVDPVSLL